MATNYSKWSFYQPKKKPKPPVRQQVVPYGAPRPPDASFMASVFPEYTERSEPEWEKLLNARVKPYEDAAKKVRTQELAQSEFQQEQAAAANERLGLGFANLFTGGKAGAEGQAFAKENFGGELMGMQAVSIAAGHLAQLTSEWNERDWKISTEYQKAMAEIPGLKEQMRESINRADTDEYTRNFNMANLLLDEAWNVYNANIKQYNTDQQLKAAKDAINKANGMVGYDNRKDAVAEASKRAAQSKFQWGVRRAKDGSWEAYQTTTLKPVSKGSQTSDVTLRNSAISEAKYRTSAGNTVWEVVKVDGQWIARDTGKKKAGSPKNNGLSNAQKAENDLVKQLFDNKTKYTGTRKVNPDWAAFPNTPAGRKARDKSGLSQYIVVEPGMDYDAAFAEFFDYAFQILSQYGRSSAYVSRWVRSRLDALYPGSKANAAKPGRG